MSLLAAWLFARSECHFCLVAWKIRVSVLFRFVEDLSIGSGWQLGKDEIVDVPVDGIMVVPLDSIVVGPLHGIMPMALRGIVVVLLDCCIQGVL